MDLLTDLQTNETWFKESRGIVVEDEAEDEDEAEAEDEAHGCISPIFS